VTVTKWGRSGDGVTRMRLGEGDEYRLVVFLVGVIVGLVAARVFDYLIYVTSIH
jgi:hypothetical protein